MTHVSTLTIRATIAGFDALGIEADAPAPIADGAPADVEALVAPAGNGLLSRLWNGAFAQRSDPTLPTQIGLALPQYEYDLLDHLAGAAPSVGHALPILNRYSGLASDRMSLQVTRGPADWVWFRYDAPDPERVIIEQWALAILRARFSQNRHFSIEEVWLSQPDNDDADRFARHWRVPVRLGKAHTGMRLTKGVCDLKNENANPHLVATLCRLADQAQIVRLSHSPIASNIVRLVRTALEQGRYSLHTIAEDLGMSARSLQRRLSEQRLSFHQIVSAYRRELALRMLDDDVKDMAAIARALGYNEQSSFTRAFQRWTGTSPKVWSNRVRHQTI